MILKTFRFYVWLYRSLLRDDTYRKVMETLQEAMDDSRIDFDD